MLAATTSSSLKHETPAVRPASCQPAGRKEISQQPPYLQIVHSMAHSVTTFRSVVRICLQAVHSRPCQLLSISATWLQNPSTLHASNTEIRQLQAVLLPIIQLLVVSDGSLVGSCAELTIAVGGDSCWLATPPTGILPSTDVSMLAARLPPWSIAVTPTGSATAGAPGVNGLGADCSRSPEVCGVSCCPAQGSSASSHRHGLKFREPYLPHAVHNATKFGPAVCNYQTPGSCVQATAGHNDLCHMGRTGSLQQQWHMLLGAIMAMYMLS